MAPKQCDEYFSEQKIGHINSFFDLEAEDIDKNVIKFDQFKGKVTVITNVASYCGKSCMSSFRDKVTFHCLQFYIFQQQYIILTYVLFYCNIVGEILIDACHYPNIILQHEKYHLPDWMVPKKKTLKFMDTTPQDILSLIIVD